MPIEYNLVPRGKPGDAKSPKKFYALAKSQGELTVRGLAEQISRTSSLSTVDVLAVLEAFLQEVPRALADGRIVRLGEFGAFQITLRGDGADTEEAFTSKQVTAVRAGFRPGRLFGQALQNATLRRADAGTTPAKKAAAAAKGGK